MNTVTMWIVGSNESMCYIHNPPYIPRVGEFIDGNGIGGWITHVQWNLSGNPGGSQPIKTVYVHLQDNET